MRLTTDPGRVIVIALLTWVTHDFFFLALSFKVTRGHSVEVLHAFSCFDFAL